MKQSNTQNGWLESIIALFSLIAFGAILWACWQDGILFTSFLSFLACIFGSMFVSGLISAILYFLIRISLWGNGLGGILLGLGVSWLTNRNNKDC